MSVFYDLYMFLYKDDTDWQVRNVLGWALLCAGKGEKALSVYGKYAATDEVSHNFGYAINTFYAFLVNGKVSEAMDVLKAMAQQMKDEHRRQLPEKVCDAMTDDAKMLAMYGIGDAEKAIVASQTAFFLS